MPGREVLEKWPVPAGGPGLFTLDQAAEVTGYTRETVRAYCLNPRERKLTRGVHFVTKVRYHGIITRRKLYLTRAGVTLLLLRPWTRTRSRGKPKKADRWPGPLTSL